MRIAIVTAAYHVAAEDPFVPVWRDMVAALAASASVTVFPLRRPAGGHPFALDGARVVPLGHGMVRLRHSPRLWRDAVRAIVGDHRANPFDAVLALQAGEAGFVASAAAARIRRPLLAHIAGGELVCHRDVGYGSQCRAIERFFVAVALRRAAIVTVGCRPMGDLAARCLGPARAHRVHLAPLGIDAGRWAAMTPHVSGFVAEGGHAAGGDALLPTPRLLSVADLRPIKDHGVLVRAFATVAARRPVRLDVVGAGETLRRTLVLCRGLGVADRIRFWGWVPSRAMPVPFGLADAFVHASRHEAQGIALIEAAMLGLPIATTRVGVADALPRDGCFTAPVGDVDALAAAIHRALDAAAAPLHSRAERRAAVIRAYDRDACADTWLSLVDAARRAGGLAR